MRGTLRGTDGPGRFHSMVVPGPATQSAGLNRALAVAGSLGVAPNYLVRLEVRGHKSGRVISLPLVMAVVDGQRYLVSMLGEKVAWFANVRAAGERWFSGTAAGRRFASKKYPLASAHPS
jgi:hypothetical protein